MPERPNINAELDEVAYFNRETAAWNERAAERSFVQQGGANEGYHSMGGGACGMVCSMFQTCNLCSMFQTCNLCSMFQTCNLCSMFQTCNLCGQTCNLCGQTCNLCGQTCNLCGQTCNACAACSGTGHQHHHPLRVILVHEDPPQRPDVAHDEPYAEHGRH
jgi:hypothetical protein